MSLLDLDIRLHLDREHVQLVVKNWDVNLSLGQDRLLSILYRREDRFTVFLRFFVDCIDDVVSAAHLNGFEKSFVLSLCLENVGLEVAIHHEDCTSCHLFESLLECLDHG